MLSESDAAKAWVEHLDIVGDALLEVTAADANSAFNLGSAIGYLMAIRNILAEA